MPVTSYVHSRYFDNISEKFSPRTFSASLVCFLIYLKQYSDIVEHSGFHNHKQLLILSTPFARRAAHSGEIKQENRSVTYLV